MSVSTKTRPPMPESRGPSAVAVPFWRLRAIAFSVGAASLGAEIAAARLLAPYFGASTYRSPARRTSFWA